MTLGSKLCVMLVITLRTGHGTCFLSAQPPFCCSGNSTSFLYGAHSFHSMWLEWGFPPQGSLPLIQCSQRIQTRPVGLSLPAIRILNTEGRWGRDPARNAHSIVETPKLPQGLVLPRFGFVSSVF